MDKKARVIALYLPQFHPIPENDAWWGRGFTEWTNVGKAKPLFPGHYQPKVPSDLGYYDLRVPETRIAQAELAKEAGIEGFCYWHYWFGNGKRLLERPFNEVLESGSPDFPFCLGWANHSWKKKTWSVASDDKLLIEQKYPGDEDYKNHFNSILAAFKDKRYIRVDGKPIFLIWSPSEMPDSAHFIKLWKRLAAENGIGDIFFAAFSSSSTNVNRYINDGYDAVVIDLLWESFSNKRSWLRKLLYRVLRRLFSIPKLLKYNDYADYYLNNYLVSPEVVPCVFPNFDHSPRSREEGGVLTEATPSNFEDLLTKLLDNMNDSTQKHNLLFIKSWNEWGEGNYLEPDLKYGCGYLEAISKSLRIKSIPYLNCQDKN